MLGVLEGREWKRLGESHARETANSGDENTFSAQRQQIQRVETDKNPRDDDDGRCFHFCDKPPYGRV